RLAAGGTNTCVVLADATLGCWGGNTDGQLATATIDRSSRPVAIAGLTGVTAISLGGLGPLATTACAVLADRSVSCWGGLSGGSSGTNAIPTVASALAGAVDVAIGGLRICATLTDGTVACSDQSSGTTAPVGTLANAQAVTSGNYHSCALLADRTVRCWGQYGNGLLGDGRYVV